MSKIVSENTDFFKESGGFKVRPGYSYDKFYLDRVDGSYDMSLQGLIHHIMFEEKIYERLLTEEQILECTRVVQDFPDCIWKPDSDEYPELADVFDAIYSECIFFTWHLLQEKGFSPPWDKEKAW